MSNLLQNIIQNELHRQAEAKRLAEERVEQWNQCVKLLSEQCVSIYETLKEADLKPFSFDYRDLIYRSKETSFELGFQGEQFLWLVSKEVQIKQKPQGVYHSVHPNNCPLSLLKSLTSQLSELLQERPGNSELDDLLIAE